MIKYHPQVSLKQFGPGRTLRESGAVEVFSIYLWLDAEKISHFTQLARVDLIRCEVELGCRSLREYDRSEPRASTRVLWTDERAEVRKAWRALVRRYERILGTEWQVQADVELDRVMARARRAFGAKP